MSASQTEKGLLSPPIRISFLNIYVLLEELKKNDNFKKLGRILKNNLVFYVFV